MSAEHLPDTLRNLRRAIEQAVPHGRTNQVHNKTHMLLYFLNCHCLEESGLLIHCAVPENFGIHSPFTY